MEAGAYQQAVSPLPLEALPDRFSAIIERIPPDVPLSVRLYPNGRGTTRTYVRTDTKPVRQGYALEHDSLAAILFADGTLYVHQEKVNIFKLPELTNGYRYTGFILSDRLLLAAWEEQRFYETGRAGILEILLPDGGY